MGGLDDSTILDDEASDFANGTYSAEVIDLQSNRDIDPGEPVQVHFEVTQDFGVAADLQFHVFSDDTTTPTTIVASSQVFDATANELDAGVKFSLNAPTNGRYLRVGATSTLDNVNGRLIAHVAAHGHKQTNRDQGPGI